MAVAISTSVRAPQRKKTQSPGRPRHFAADDVVDAALELFWKGGYRSTTTRELETGLDLRVSSIYNAFGSKKALLNAALDRYEAMTDVRVLRPLETSPLGIDAVHQFFTDLVNWITHKGHRGCILTNMMAEDGGATEAISTRARHYRERVRRILYGALKRAASTGEIAGDRLEARADLLLTAVLGLNIVTRGGATNGELRRLHSAVRAEIDSWKVV